MKIIDTGAYVSTLRELTEEGHEVNMLISGNSMSPFMIHQRDYIYFSKPTTPLKKGDMVFYQRDNGQFVMHRICKVCKDGTYHIVGDAQQAIEPGIRRDQIFARVNKVKRKGKMIEPNSFWWFFFEKIWINIIPFRPLMRKMYSLIARIKHQENFFSNHIHLITYITH